MRVSFTSILRLQRGSLFWVPGMKELGERKAGVPHKWSLAFLSQAEERVTSDSKKPNSPGKSGEDSEPGTAFASAPGRVGVSPPGVQLGWEAHSLQAWMGEGAPGSPV